MGNNFLNLNKKIFLTFAFLSSFLFTLKLTGEEVNQNEIIKNQIIKNDISQKDLINKNRYLLAAGDLLTITFIEVKDFSGDYVIMPDGTINLPLIGEVEADFISIDQLTKKLTSLYGQQLIRPDLFITLKNRRDIRVSVIGEVNRPGLYNLSEADDSSSGLNKDSYIFPTIIDAISKAGGITPRSDIGSVRIERRIENEKIKFKETKIDLVNLLMKGDQSQNLILFDGDIVEIPEVVNNKNFSRKVLQIAKGNLSPKTITINVVGAVEKPGEYKVKPNTPLMKGILVANGLKPFEASHNNVQLLRIRSNGSISVKKFKFNINEKLSYDSNPPLLDGDLIKVNKNNFSKVSGGIRTISQPFADILSSYSLFKLINE